MDQRFRADPRCYSRLPNGSPGMCSLRSSARSRFALVLFLLGSVAQQVGAVAHGTMLVRAGGLADPLHEVCTSAGLVRVPGVPEPAQPPASAGVTCDLCATATAAFLPAIAVDLVAIVPRHDAKAARAAVLPLSSRSQRAYRSRAPPVSLSA